MITLLKRLFVENWQRKLISLILAMIIWLVVNHSMTATKAVSNVPIRVTHLPEGKTIEGMQANGILDQKMTLVLTGNRQVLDEISSKDLEVRIDATGKPLEWKASIGKSDLLGLNPEIDLVKGIAKVAPAELTIKQSRLVSEKIPVLITQPIGEAPKGYQFLDIWPYQLYMTIHGPEETVKRLKANGLKIAFNLNDISRSELDILETNQKVDEISFFVPNSWKKVAIPGFSEAPLAIDDPAAKLLRIDFSRQDLLPIGVPIPVTVFYPPKYSQTLNPETYTLAPNEFISTKNGVKVIAAPLYAQGVSQLFLETVREMLQIAIIASPKTEHDTLLWSVQFLYPQELEDRYVAKVLAKTLEAADHIQAHLREEYLRNRFRSYMNRFRLYTLDREKLALKIELALQSIVVTPQNLHHEL